MTMDFCCPDCNSRGGIGPRCDKHQLEWLKYEAETAQNAYLEELKKQSRKGTQTEREQDAKL